MGKTELCPYCHEDSYGYTTPFERNCHIFLRFGMNGCELNAQAFGRNWAVPVNYCPMCGRKLMREGEQDG